MLDTAKALEAAISRDRLSKYLRARDGNLEAALQLYAANTALSEAFYTPLQSLEICLRNRIDAELRVWRGENWLLDPPGEMLPDSAEEISRARQNCETSPAEKLHGDMVAELKFSFWVGLLGPRYDARFWRFCLHRCFRGGGGKPRRIVHGRFNNLRRFRNRVAHHEPVFERDLALIHAELLEAIGWMCPHVKAWTQAHSRVQQVIAAQSY